MESVQEKIFGILKETFSLERPIDIEETFESIGFDSLKLTVLQYKLSQLGYSFDIEKLVLSSTIKDLMEHISSEEHVLEADSGSSDYNETLLSPGQNWFLHFSPLNKDSWNVIQLFEVVDENFNVDIFRAALDSVVARHSILRTSFHHSSENRYVKKIDKQIAPDQYMHIYDSSSLEEIYSKWIPLAEQELRANRAPLFICWHISDVLTDRRYMLLLINHLIADAYSLSLFYREVYASYQDLIGDYKKPLETRLDRLEDLLVKVKHYVNASSYITDLSYWKTDVWKTIPPIPLSSGASGKNNTFSSKRIVERSLSQEQTRILNKLPKLLNSEKLSDILIFALTQSITQFTDSDYAQLVLIDSGRAYFHKVSGIDTSNIMGWLALSSLTLVKRIDYRKESRDAFDEFNRFLHQSPQRGLGYDLVYLCDDKTALEGVHTIKDKDKIVFNYLGEVDFDTRSRTFNGGLREVYNTHGLKEQGDDDRACCFRIVSMIKQSKFSIFWEYSENYHSEEDISEMCNVFMTNLVSLIEHYSEK